MSRTILLVLGVAFVTGCAGRYEISRFAEPPRSVCIAENGLVRPDFRDALVESLRERGLQARVTPGFYHYAQHGRMYALAAEVAGCDAVVGYDARYGWDLVTYLAGARVWISDDVGTTRRAGASYQSNAFFGHFRSTSAVVDDMLDRMLGASR